jgi:hypothetical protein
VKKTTEKPTQDQNSSSQVQNQSTASISTAKSTASAVNLAQQKQQLSQNSQQQHTATMPTDNLIQPQPVGQQPRESKGAENEVEALDPFVKEVLNSRAIPKSVKQKIREECWSLFNDPKTPRGVKQCILDNMVAKARQE